MTSPTKLILIRHGETEFNRQGRILGRGPEPLNATGKRQARRAARAVATMMPFALYASPLVRTVQTAQYIADEASVDLIKAPGLEEIDVGDLEGLTGTQLQEAWPDVMRSWRTNPAEVTMPNGESVEQVRRRAWAAVNEILGRHPGGTVVVASHNFPIQTLVCTALGMPLNNFRQVRVDLGSITRLEVKESVFTLVSLNETGAD